ncbi:MAG: phospholipase D-like domain-containing protein [Vicinamibacterales bacterium]|nr:phospholipase D-like domain-containing protein [Vicinamibacterales bacterium]
MPSPVRLLADQAFSRAAGAPLVQGNAVRILKDARENYPAWLDAIAGAERWIHFESYIIHGDAVGRRFAEALAERARAGVRVRVLYDWAGGLFTGSGPLWRLLRAAGAEIRVFNPPRLHHPVSWMSRDHRKMLAVDGEIGFVAGLCVGQAWEGDTARGVEPWRDTGVAIRGPAVADIEHAFVQVWNDVGDPLPADERVDAATIPPAGEVALRVIDTMPATAGMMRLDQLVAALARRTLWIADAYFVGTPAHTQALRAAADDGVDVRLLVPGGSDLVLLQPLTRAGYRPLLEGGVRIFEWNGPMMHAKTAVADGKWSRVGSSNLNLQSWLGNWELDVAIEDEVIGRDMAAMFEDDLAHATEVVLDGRHRVPRIRPARRSPARRGSAGRAAAGALRLGNTLGAVLTLTRTLGPSDARTLFYGALFLLVTGAVGLAWPRALAWPLGAVCLWVGLGWTVEAWHLWRRRRAPSSTGGPDQPARK